MDGDTIVFRRWATGKLDYHVNGAPKVIDLTSLELQDGRTIFLDGTSAGSWPSNRCTTPVNSSDAERVLALYRGCGCGFRHTRFSDPGALKTSTFLLDLEALHKVSAFSAKEMSEVEDGLFKLGL